ncbi:MAG: homocysteine S-methyltransferase family protein [Clostridia bacterium]|nr:homocysteine S-methyltransferase family protein [Clostridia bacterium]
MNEKRNQLQALLAAKPFVFLDGGMGTMLQKAGLELGRIPEVLNLTHPETVTAIHRQYIDAGSDIVYCCSFGVNRLKVAGTPYTAPQLIQAAVGNARAACRQAAADDEKAGRPARQVLVALDIGPCGKMLEPNGDLSFTEAYELFREEVVAGAEAGADLIVIETMTDLYEMRAALLAAKENADLPVLATMSFEENRRTFTGTLVSSMALTLAGLGADAIGINCSLGPKEFLPLIEELSRWTELPLVVKPNAGLPDPQTGAYAITPAVFAEQVAALIPYGIRFVGGCCGTDPSFIQALHDRFSGLSCQPQHPRIPAACCSPEETVVIDRPRIIGERINPTGKKKLKEAYRTGDIDYILGLAAEQVEDGAAILDVNAGVPGIDEATAIEQVVKALQGVCTAPLQIDSNSAAALERGLRAYCGKAIVNSVNGESAKLDEVLPIVKKYGAAVVGLTLDEEGIPKTVEKRVEIARRILDRALSYGIPKQDVYIDCLTLTVSAEQENAANTLLAMRRIKEELGLKTVLGVSNISFGLPNRPLINKNFLQMALTCGLDLPIINPGDREMVRAVDVYDLIMNHDRGAVKYLERYTGELETPAVSTARTAAPAAAGNPAGTGKETELAYAIRHGLATRVQEITRDMLKTREPLEVINLELIPVLDQAGVDFESGRIFIPQLILTASTAQSAFDVVKEEIRAGGTVSENQGTIVVATVKGDIHDIGKNIVKVILENYGYEIIDLGKDVDPRRIVETCERENVKLLGLSALMTTTLPSMEETIRLVRERCPGCRIMAGGAVLTEEYALKIGADFYVKDAKASCDSARKVFRNS